MNMRSRAAYAFTAICVAALSLMIFVTGTNSADATATAEVLIDSQTEGYYNASIGNKLDGLLPWFPTAPADPDPTLKPADEPDPEELVNRAGLAALIEDDPLPLGSGWSEPQPIPTRWTTTTETAILYEIDAGPLGIKDLTGKFGVDNGIYVWVDGKYKFGAMEPGGAPLGEYETPLGDLKPGMHYLQILREDHGAATGYAIEVSGVSNVGNAVLGGQVEQGSVRYGDEIIAPGEVFYPETCLPGRFTSDDSCSTILTLLPTEPAQTESEGSALVSIFCANETNISKLFSLWFLRYYDNPYSAAFGDKELAIWFAQLKTDSICFQSESRAILDDSAHMIGLQNGAGIFSTSIPAMSIVVDAQLAFVEAEGPTTFVAGYAPSIGEATFLAFNAPITITRPTGIPLTLKPGQVVTLTGLGFGEIQDLPRILMPAVLR